MEVPSIIVSSTLSLIIPISLHRNYWYYRYYGSSLIACYFLNCSIYHLKNHLVCLFTTNQQIHILRIRKILYTHCSRFLYDLSKIYPLNYCVQHSNHFFTLEDKLLIIFFTFLVTFFPLCLLNFRIDYYN